MGRIKFNQRLENLGITQFDYCQYDDLFVKQHTRYWKRYDRSDWFQMQNHKTDKIIPLTKYEIARFLAGEFWIAKAMAGQNDFFCLDLDFIREKEELIERYEMIRDRLPGPLVLQSSASWGLHLYYFFDRNYWRPDIEKSVMARLRKARIPIERGYVEPFPGMVSQLRLPLGKDSHVLDYDTLEPMGLTLKESIQFCVDFKEETKRKL